MIELIPAIDIIDGKCVRLSRGDYSTKKVYGDPLFQALEFERIGFRRLHIVDLDGAKKGEIVNIRTLEAISSKTNLKIDFGGGIRTSADLKDAFNAGAQAVTIGSLAVKTPEVYFSWLEEYGADRLILGADTRCGKISINGWEKDSSIEVFDFLDYHLSMGTKNVLCTDISRDGMMMGPSIELYSKIMSLYPNCYLIASGGVRTIQDIISLEMANIPAVVFGKAIYEGTINLEELLSQC